MKVQLLPVRFATILLVSSLTAAVFAQSTNEISTVRPRITDTTSIVAPNKLQFEAGLDFGFGGFDGGRSNNFGQALLRYGLNNRMEVRLALPTYLDNQDFDAGDGWSDLTLGVSYYLGSYGKARFSVLPGLTIPSGSRFQRVDKVAPSISFTGEMPIGENWSLASTLGYMHSEYEFNGFEFKADTYRATLAVQRSLGANASAFAEYFGSYANGSEPFHSSNFGARLRLSSNSQVDARVIVPIQNPSQNSFGVGYSIRF